MRSKVEQEISRRGTDTAHAAKSVHPRPRKLSRIEHEGCAAILWRLSTAVLYPNAIGAANTGLPDEKEHPVQAGSKRIARLSAPYAPLSPAREPPTANGSGMGSGISNCPFGGSGRGTIVCDKLGPSLRE